MPVNGYHCITISVTAYHYQYHCVSDPVQYQQAHVAATVPVPSSVSTSQMTRRGGVALSWPGDLLTVRIRILFSALKHNRQQN